MGCQISAGRRSNEANAGQALRHHIGRRTDMMAVVVRHPAGIPLPLDSRDEQLHAKTQGKGCRRPRSRVRSYSRTNTSHVSHRPLYDDQSNAVLAIAAEAGRQWHLALSAVGTLPRSLRPATCRMGHLQNATRSDRKSTKGKHAARGPSVGRTGWAPGSPPSSEHPGERMTSRGLRGVALERL